MSKTTDQMRTWQSEFGRAYTDRNLQSHDEMEKWYRENFGFTRTQLNERFVGGLGRSCRVLEVGANVGCQLEALQHMGFSNLYGIELQPYAVEMAKTRTKNINIIQGSGFDIPFKDGYFDLVFTSGVLFHISPSDLREVLGEIYRCSARFIWGLEYWADTVEDIQYRGREGLLWKADYPRIYLAQFPDLRLVKEERIKYLQGNNVDCMFLLERARA